MSTDFTDDWLVQRFKAGDESAFARLDEQYRESIVRSLSHLVTREVAEDLYQESLLKAAQAIHTFHGGNFRAWLYQIAKNRGIDYLRKQRQYQPLNWEDTTTVACGDPVHQLEAREIREKIDREIAALPPRQQTVARLRLYDNLKFSQIATIVGGSSKTIKALFHHARRRLQDRVSLYLAAIHLPFQQLSRLESLLPTISKPAVGLTVLAMATILTTDKPLRDMSPIRSYRHPDLRLAAPPSVSHLKQRVLNPPISPAFGVETKHFSAVIPVLSDPPLREELHWPLLVNSADLVPRHGLYLTKSAQQIASPMEGAEPSISTPPTRAATMIDEIPHLDLDAAEDSLNRPLLHDRQPGRTVNWVWVRVADSSQSETNPFHRKRQADRNTLRAIYAKDAEQVKLVAPKSTNPSVSN